MSRNFKDLATASWAKVLAVVGGEAVINGAKTGQGIVQLQVNPAFDTNGVSEPDAGQCRVLYDVLGPVQFGQTVQIGDRTVIVGANHRDASGAILTFDWRATSPVAEAPL